MVRREALNVGGWAESVRTRVVAVLASEAVRGAGLSLGLKIGGSALNFLMLTLIARDMNATEFGVFAFWFNALLFLAVVSGLGQERLILRHWTEYSATGAWDLARGIVLFGFRNTIAGSLLIAGAVVIAGTLHGSDPLLTGAAALFVVLQTMFYFTAHLNRAVIGIFSGDVNDMTWRAVVIVATTTALLTRTELQAAHVFVIACVGTSTGLAAQTVTVLRRLPAAFRAAARRAETRTWVGRSMRIAIGANLEAAAQYLEIVAVGLVLPPAPAGAYFVAARLANLFLMISGGLDSYTTRQIPRQHFAHGRAGVTDTLRKIAMMVAGPVALGLVATILFGRQLLGLFGTSFVDAYPVLVILSAGTGFLALAGPAMPVLVLTGHEGTYSLCLGANLAVRLAALLGLAWLFRPVGAAIGSAAGIVTGAVVLNIACRRQAGLDPALTVLLPARR